MEINSTKPSIADPTSLGLLGLAMVTLIAASQKLGWTQGYSFILPWAIFLGAFAQLMTSYADSKRNNLFGSVVFGAYGLFWLGVASCWLIKMGVFGTILAENMDVKQLGLAFLGYLVFSIAVTVAALKTNKVIFIILIFIDFLFLGLSLASFGIGATFWTGFAAYSELMISILSFYGSSAALLNAQFNREILPMGKFL